MQVLLWTAGANITTTLVAAALGLRRYRSLDPSLQILTGYLVFDALTDVVMMVLAARRVNTIWLSHVLSIFQVVFLTLVLSGWQRRKRLAGAFNLLAGGYIVLWMALLARRGSVFSFGVFTKPALCLVLVFMAGMTMVQLVEEERPALADPRFWVSGAVMLGFMIIFLPYIVMDWLPLQSADQARSVWGLRNALLCLTNLAILRGFACT